MGVFYLFFIGDITVSQNLFLIESAKKYKINKGWSYLCDINDVSGVFASDAMFVVTAKQWRSSAEKTIPNKRHRDIQIINYSREVDDNIHQLFNSLALINLHAIVIGRIICSSYFDLKFPH